MNGLYIDLTLFKHDKNLKVAFLEQPIGKARYFPETNEIDWDWDYTSPIMQELANAQIIAQSAKIKQAQTQQYALYGGLGLVVIFLIFVFNRLQVTRKQKNIIETQKLEVEQQKAVVEKAHLLLEEKNNEIIASIRYAKRIQDALMTSQKYIERNIERLKNK